MPHRLDRAVEPLERAGLPGPQERAQPQSALGARHVDWIEVDPDPPPHARLERKQLGRHRTPLLAVELDERVGRPPRAGLVDVAMAIPEQVEARARAELDHVEGIRVRAPRDLEEARQEQPRAPHLVRLDRPRGQLRQVGMREGGVELVPAARGR